MIGRKFEAMQDIVSLSILRMIHGDVMIRCEKKYLIMYDET
jgi:hypothetical protein